MWIALSARHPVELMIINTLAIAPLLYLAFTLAARTDRAARRAPLDARTWAWRGVLVGVIWGAATLVDRYFMLRAMGEPGDVAGLIVARPFETLFPALAVVGVALVRPDWWRGALLAVLALVYALGPAGLLDAHLLEFRTPAQRWTAFATIATGIALMGFGAVLMTTPSHPGRTCAVLLCAWGSKLLEFAVLSVTWPAIETLSASAGIITPQLILVTTLGVLCLGVIALAEARRLRSSAFRKGLLEVSEARMRLLADATHEGLLVHREGRVVDANDRFRRMVGGDDPRGASVSAFLPDGGAASAEGGERLVRSDGSDMPVETIHRRLDDDREVIAVRDLTQMRADQRRIRHLAEHDGLTGILNRSTLDAALAERVPLAVGRVASADEAPGRAGDHADPIEAAGSGRTEPGSLQRAEPGSLQALLVLDLDRFKPINDTYGHATGDAVLRALASRFCSLVREGDLVARIGGDEFAVLAGVEDPDEAMALAARLLAAAREPVTAHHSRLEAGASIGVALAPEDATAPSQLMQAADLALYAAKRDGRDRVVRFEPGMAEEAHARVALETDLRRALERGEIELHYQVQHDLKAGGVVGYEALMRWRHPQRGLVSPATFIPIAEETGLIVPLGRWALERAARDFAAFDDRTRIAVNVSPVQFAQADVVADARHALDASGLAPERLEIEVTEQLFLADTDSTLRALEALRELGVGLSLDDFGSGYSSLAYLTRFPFSKIKIDRQFVDRMASDDRSDALVRSILALAASLGLRVTAEGVETHGQLVTLARGRCDEAQGYLLGRPLPLAEIVAAAGEALGGEAVGGALIAAPACGSRAGASA